MRREKVAFEPLTAGKVTMYLCGPTVYNYAHIGNARPAGFKGRYIDSAYISGTMTPGIKLAGSEYLKF